MLKRWSIVASGDHASMLCLVIFFFSSRRRHTRCSRDWSSDVCSSDLFRSETHSLAWIGFTGIGVIVAAQTVFAATAKPPALGPLPSAALLGVPLALAY